MTVEMRDYQIDGAIAIGDALGEHKAVCYQLPTGGGKSVVLSEFARYWPGKVFWATHRRELVTQSSGHLQRAHRHDAIVDSPIRMWNRIQKGEYAPESSDLIIFDEAHHSAAMTWARLIESWPGKVLGATATPWRLSKKEGLDHLFDELVCGPQVSELIEAGHLAAPHVKIPHEDERIKGAGSSGGDYTDLATWNANSHNIMVELAVKWMLLHSPDKAIIYACGIEHGKALLDYIGTRRKAALLTSETPPDERARIDAEFRGNQLDTLINLTIVTEGYDIPSADCVVLTRPTKSLALYLQMVGRALRPKDKPALILDCCGMSLDHGLPEQDRNWSLTPRADGPPGEPFSMPICEECDTHNPPMQKYCIGCGVQRWHTCERCSKPVFHEDGPNTECERCSTTDLDLIKSMTDDYGNPLWCEKWDRPILGYTKINIGLYAGLFGAIWRCPPTIAPTLEPGTTVTLKSRADNEQGRNGTRARIADFVESARWGTVYATDRTVRDAEKQGTVKPAGKEEPFDAAAHVEKFNAVQSDEVSFW